MEKIEKANKKKVIEYLLISLGALVLSVVLIIFTMKIGKSIGTWLQIILLILAFLIMGFGIVFMSYTDWYSTAYTCKECNTIFKASFLSYLFRTDIKGKKYLKCPKCEKTTTCYKIKNIEQNDKK